MSLPLRRIIAGFVIGLVVHALSPVADAVAGSGDWPQFRGPNFSGASSDATPPAEVGPSNNVLWAIEVPWSPSSPCVSGQRIFISTFADGELQTRCYGRSNGKLLWSKGIKPEKLEVFHSTEGSPAASTPATDGGRVVSYFGSFGLVCYDVKGRELWRHPLPVAVSGGSYGSGASPVISRGRVFVNRDQDMNSSLLAVDLGTGKTLWETARPEAIGGFCTPVVWKNQREEEVVVAGSTRLKGYETRTGRERWMVEPITGLCCPSPAVGDGLLFFAAWSPGKADSPWPSWEGFLARYDKNKDGEVSLEELDPQSREFMRGMDRDHDGKISKTDWDKMKAGVALSENVLVAVKPGGSGNISQTHVAWKATRGLPYVPSALYYDGRVYVVRDGGMLSSFDGRSGKPFYSQERLEAAESYYASPVAANGCIYLASLPGRLTVVKAGGDKPEILHQASFGERIFATPALAGPNLYLRTQGKLYAFGKGRH